MIIIGQNELSSIPLDLNIEASPVSFSQDVLDVYKETHFLIYTPTKYKDGSPITLNSLRNFFGVNPSHDPCFYNQDWYLNEDFAKNTSLDGKWHLMAKNVRDDMRGRQPENIEKTFSREQFPTAVTAAFSFFAYWFHTGGEKLWKNDFTWCRDLDHNGDRIYVGRYEDPDGVNKNGFNIHRHLSIRDIYSVALEIK